MIRHCTRFALVCVSLTTMAVFVSPLSACLNDSEAPQREVAFQDSYEIEFVQPMVEPTPSGAPLVLASMAVGGVLLVGSLGFSLWKLKARS